MKFWDSSAVVPLLIPEASSEMLTALMREDPAAAIWWSTPVECASAVARCEREGRLSREDAAVASRLLTTAVAGWAEVAPTDRIRDQAMRLLRLHSLRGADALQLAAALVLADFDAKSLPFVTRDAQLAAAAELEGFEVLGA